MKSKVLVSGLATCLILAACSGGETGTTGSTGGDPGAGGSAGPTSSSGNNGSTGTASTASTGAAGTTASTSGSTGSGTTSSAGQTGTSASTGSAGQTGTGGSTSSGTGGSTGAGGGDTVDCTTPFPSGGTPYTGTNINGSSDGLNYGIWTNGTGGTITVFPNVHAFSASWDQSKDFLAHVGLDFNTAKAYTAYGTIQAEFVEVKSGTNGNTYSSIGMYGWMHSPCIEWYINEDSYSGYVPKGSITAMVDGAMYYLSTSQTTGTGGANACEQGHTGGWTNITATRATPRQCGMITVSDHFASWAAQGWSLGTLSSVHINVEVGGGTGSIQFPVANVTTTSK